MTVTMQQTERLYALVNIKKGGIIYGLGPNKTDAWDNGCLVYFGAPWNSAEERVETLKGMRHQGWRARKVEVTYDAP